MSYINLTTQQSAETLPSSAGDFHGLNPGRDWGSYLAMGWRVQTEPPAVADGWERTVRGWVQCPDDPNRAVLDFSDTLTADRIAAERAAKLATLTPELLQVAGLYLETMTRIFGPGAETNRQITRSYVVAYFEQKRRSQTITAQDDADLLALKTYFELIAAWTGDGTAWSFPYEVLQ